MEWPRDIISDLGGLAATHELYAAGFTRKQLTYMSASGAIYRVRQGWYALPDTHPQLRRAARVGGKATGLTAARHLAGPRGDALWVYPDERLHVAVPVGACRLRTAASARKRLVEHPEAATCTHWVGDAGGSRLIVGHTQMMRDVVACNGVEAAFTLAESALHVGLIGLEEWENILAGLPVHAQAALSRASWMSESGIESLFRFRMREHPVGLRAQVTVEGVGRVDFMLGDQLIVELDGFSYHSSREQFEADRTRDAELSRRGFQVLRFSFRQVMERWAEVERSVFAVLQHPVAV